MTRAERFTRPCTFHGEGPFWDADHGRLLLVDMLAGAVVEVDAEGGTARHPLAGVAAAIRARRDGGYILATEDRFVLLGADLDEQTVLPPVFVTRRSTAAPWPTPTHRERGPSTASIPTAASTSSFPR